MVEVPGGTFMMGSKDGQDDELPVHRVTLDAFCLDLTPVTVEAYARCSTCTPIRTCNLAGKGQDDHPQNCVGWSDAMGYCKSAGKTLPTEAQWEYAASGGAEQRKWSLGSEPANGMVCVGRGFPHDAGTCPVRAHPAGAFGLLDMAGNVWEWTADWYGRYPATPQKNPTGRPSGETRSMRGGSWESAFGYELRAALRGNFPPDTGSGIVGFRCAKAR
jgi:formylglycine-generating enzyme required for sulfatase activity